MKNLHTPRLILRPCRPSDRDDFIALEQDPHVMRFLNGGLPVDRANTPMDAGFLMPEGMEPYVWTALSREDGAFVGWFCLYPETESEAELGYRLAPTAWGKGFASEGAVALTEWGFRSAGYEKITACTMAVNHASRRVMDKIGMRHVRTDYPAFRHPIQGSELGEVWYELQAPASSNT